MFSIKIDLTVAYQMTFAINTKEAETKMYFLKKKSDLILYSEIGE